MLANLREIELKEVIDMSPKLKNKNREALLDSIIKFYGEDRIIDKLGKDNIINTIGKDEIINYFGEKGLRELLQKA